MMSKALRIKKLRDSSPVRYAAAVGCVWAALLVRLALTPVLGSRFPLIINWIAVSVCARFFGRWPGVAACVLGALMAPLFLGLEPIGPSRGSAGLALYFVGCFAAIWMTETLHRSRREAEQARRLAGERLLAVQDAAAQRIEYEQVSARLRAIVESSSDAIVSKGLTGVIESWNRGAERIFGYSMEEALGKPIAMLTPPDCVEEEVGIVARIRQGWRVDPFETVRLRKNGERIQVSLTISPVLDVDGKLRGASYIARDITERKALDEALRESQRLEGLGVLAGGLAHDFNNVLTGIMGNASLAMDEPASAAARQRIAEILLASERAAMTIRQILAYAGKGRYVVEPVDLSKKVADLRPLIQASVPTGARLEFQLDQDLPLVEADAAQLQQVVMNLVINAGEAFGERPGTISIAAFSREISGSAREVVLQVGDNGSGIDAATKERIFDPFFSTKFTGRGLGLPAARGIVQAHHGTISVESAPGAGSTFTVVIPAASQRAVAASAAQTGSLELEREE